MRKRLQYKYEEIASFDNLLEAWKKFLKGKRMKQDVHQFSLNLMDNIVTLSHELANKTYVHGEYHAFNISDPKPRHIHKAQVRDRLLHHAVHQKLYPFFSNIFIADSFSCQNNKGAHRALNRFRSFACKVSKNNTRTCWVLKCDIRKFFANIHHTTLIKILASYIPDRAIMNLLKNIIDSFYVTRGVGLPLGNLTSQLFVNIYMNEFDQFVKHQLKIKYYIRYCDDFVIFSKEKKWLEQLIPQFKDFLAEQLKLQLHPMKVFIKPLASGVDFLGWVHFSDYRIPRSTTKRRMIKRLRQHPRETTLQSYLGLLKHGNTQKLRQVIIKEYYLNR